MAEWDQNKAGSRSFDMFCDYKQEVVYQMNFKNISQIFGAGYQHPNCIFLCMFSGFPRVSSSCQRSSAPPSAQSLCCILTHPHTHFSSDLCQIFSCSTTASSTSAQEQVQQHQQKGQAAKPSCGLIWWEQGEQGKKLTSMYGWSEEIWQHWLYFQVLESNF